MPPRFIAYLVLVALLFLFVLPTQAISETKQIDTEYLNLSLGVGLEFESGDYGTGVTTDSWRIPFIVEWVPIDRLGLSLEIPYVQQNNTNETIFLGGGGINNNASGNKASSSNTGGLGDITLDVSFTLLEENNQSPRLLALLYSKLPTADEQDGLGTGEFDWGAGLGLAKKFGKWSIYAEALSMQPGSSATFDPDNYWEWLVSLSYRARTNLRPGVSLSGGSTLFDDTDRPLEIKGRLSGITGKNSSYSVYISRGLSDASQDWGFGIFGYLDF
jgi:hypothetical protein